MREIKFRAWDGYKMWNVNEINWDQDGSLDSVGYEHIIDIDIPKLMQYTGLKDKNGVEIYEGDVVEYKDYSRGAYFSLSSKKDIQPRRKYVVDISHIVEDIYHWFPGGGMKTKEHIAETEVIGNIYENPELLEK